MSMISYKYAPSKSSEIVGQNLSMSILRSFVINYDRQKSKAALLYGPVGVGKTASVYALAEELDFDILELNSSDLRNEQAIKSFLDSALGQQSLFFKKKIILIDEIDNISGVKDRGCVGAIVKAVSKSTFPVVLTANDIYDKKMKPLLKISQKIQFERVDYSQIALLLSDICSKEGIKFDEKSINSLARQADGDVRAALLDLQICMAKGEIKFEDVVNLSDRKRTQSILQAMAIIFKSSKIENALSALNDVDCDINHIFLWLDNNIAREYKDPKSLAKAYDILSRADVFNGRIRKRQHWRFLAYVNNLLTAGISSAKVARNPAFVDYKQSMRLLRIWQFNMKLAKKKAIAKKLAAKTHVSTKVAMGQIVYFREIFRNKGGGAIADELDLTSDEVSWLSSR
jgi:replication factor C large subunit